MKKKMLSKKVLWMRDVGLKAFAVLALVIGGFYTYAAITWPADTPNSTTGVVGTFVGESTSAFGATGARGYNVVNDLCEGIKDPAGQTVSGAHVCTPDEMVNSNNHGKDNVSPIFTYSASTNASATLWINSGPPGYSVNANDCVGWNVTDPGSTDNPNMGAVWNFASKKGGLVKCSNNKKFACCK